MQSDLLVVIAARRKRRTTMCMGLGNANHVVSKRHHIITELNAIVQGAWGNEYGMEDEILE